MLEFWNGNKTRVRKRYEWDLLTLLLGYSPTPIKAFYDLTDYPKAEDEASVLERGASLLVTVAGNRKFEGKDFIEIKKPLCRGLLGQRLLIVKQERAQEFKHLEQQKLKQMKLGVPATWVDAELFRANGYNVLEEGSLEQMLAWLSEEKVDYLTLGVSEAQDMLDSIPSLSDGLTIEPTLLISYPFPIVFYINSERPELAALITSALEQAELAGELEALYNKYFHAAIVKANLGLRTKINLFNPLVPDDYL